MRNIIAPLAAALALTACNPGPKPAACLPTAMPAAAATGESESTYRFRIARACVDHAADDLAPTHSGYWREDANGAVAACATEVRAALLAMTPEERDALSGTALSGIDIPISESDWGEYAYARVRTLSTPPCG